jgi:hypothetical protein
MLVEQCGACGNDVVTEAVPVEADPYEWICGGNATLRPQRCIGSGGVGEVWQVSNPLHLQNFELMEMGR